MLSVRQTVFLLGIVGIVGIACTAIAQDLEPRAYTAAPIGTNFVGIAGGHSSGGVVFDSSLPITNVQATINSTAIGGGRTFSFLGRTALAVATFPYVWGSVTGQVDEQNASITRSGLVDPRLKLSINLVGGRALTLQEFATKKRPTTIIGVSVTVVPPLGQYDPQKLINLGSNRWAFKPEAGYSRAIKNWTLDGYAGVWLFTANDRYFTGASIRSQQPVLALQGHTSYTIRPRLWVAFDATWYSGGTTIVDGIDKQNPQSNIRIGATFSFPLTRHQSIKTAYSRGAATRIGQDFTTISAAWQYSWFD